MGEPQRLDDLVQHAERDLQNPWRAVEQHERRYRDLVARDDAKADLALEFVQEARRDVPASETRLQATRDALSSVPDEASRDRLLDFAIDLRGDSPASSTGRTASKGSTASSSRRSRRSTCSSRASPV